MALGDFGGVARRFERKGEWSGHPLIEDYAHHPTEIRATLAAAVSVFAPLKPVVVFQPHRFTRTEKLWDDFVAVFASMAHDYEIKTLLITDIYPASEQPIPGVTAERLVAAIKQANQGLQVQYVADFYKLADGVRSVVHEGDLVLTLGAGKLNQLADALVSAP